MVNWSFLSFLPFVGHRFKKSVYIEYVHADSIDFEKALILDNTKKYKCGCCWENYDTNEIVTCNKSTNDEPHTFCKKCVAKYINCGISDANIKRSCMCVVGSGICNGIFTAGTITECVGEETCNKFKEMLEIKEINIFYKKLKNYQVCPSCHKCGIVVDREILKCKKENCRKKWCSKCGRPDHTGYACNRISDPNNIDAIRTVVEETINYALTHKCPKCKSIYVKEEGHGCNHMTCSVCSVRSCYLCGMQACCCPAYNKNKNDNVKDDGNWLYNRKKIIMACKNLVIVNDKDVQLIMIQELKKHDINIDIRYLTKE